MQPRSRVRVVPSQSAVDRWRGEEHHVRAGVVLARATGRAAGERARDAVFEGYAVAWEVFGSWLVWIGVHWWGVGHGNLYDHGWWCSVGI